MAAKMSETNHIEYPFYQQVAATQKLYTIMDEQGIPTPQGEDGQAAMPFWSTEGKALAFIQANAGYQAFKPYEIDYEIFKEKWFEGLVQDDLLVGLDWLDASESACVTEVEILVREVQNVIKSQPLRK